ncbi:unnamed protein product [Soboliphyme baturini]|uniref:Uncharacterized protein n=1 Tax=Soboliphyme baturini TaxID=241478 RepID=A0A183IID7_9BILA|nr:unnamed protein product [Soboliphyme baturini]
MRSNQFRSIVIIGKPKPTLSDKSDNMILSKEANTMRMRRVFLGVRCCDDQHRSSMPCEVWKKEHEGRRCVAQNSFGTAELRRCGNFVSRLSMHY